MLGESREEPVKIMAGELPGKRLGDSLVTLLEGEQALGQNVEVGEVVGAQDLALNYREVDLDLVEPGGVYWEVDEPQIGPGTLKALHRRLPSMRGAIVHHPEDPIRRGVGLHAHHLIYQPTERLDAVLRLAAPEELRSMHVPSGQVGQRPFSFILVLHPHEPLLVGWQGGLAAMASLDGGFLVGRDHVLLGTERLTLPFTLVEVQHPPGFMGEVGISGRNPGAVVEGPQGIFGKPSPDGGSRDLGHEPPLHRLPGHFPGAPAAQGNPATSRKLASQCLKLYPCRRGERSGACPSVADPPVLLTPLGKSACATYRPSGAWCKASVRSPCWGSLLRPKARSWREPPPSGEQCGRWLASPERRAHPRWVVHGTDFGWACNKPSPLGNTTSTKTLPRKENASKKFSQGPLSLRDALGIHDDEYPSKRTTSSVDFYAPDRGHRRFLAL